MYMNETRQACNFLIWRIRLSIEDILNAVRYVSDKKGRPEAVLVDLSAWEDIVNRLQDQGTEQLDTQQSPDEWEQAMIREEIAYQELHPKLLSQYPGQNVAIFQGRLIDHDSDAAALYRRVRKNFPGKFVLITPVQPTAEEEYTIYSPRLEELYHN